MSAEPTFYAIRNLKCFDVRELGEPWLWDSSEVPWQLEKKDFKKWLETPTAEHRLVSLCRGQLPGVRIGADNPVDTVGGFIADYDGAVPEDYRDIAAGARAPNGFLPAYAVTTKSDQLRLVWLFASPLRVTGTDHAKRFLAYVADRLQVRKSFGGFDEKASCDPGTYFCIGKSWERLSDYRISEEQMMRWDCDVFRRMLSQERTRTRSVQIPPQDLLAEARSRPTFQGVPPTFDEGQRCRRFWDQGSDNDCGCTVTADGVRVYVPHDKPLMRWADIFGREWVAKYESAKYAAVCGDGIRWDRAKGTFWSRDADTGVWVTRTVPSLTRELKVAGYSAVTPKGETCSEVERLLLQLEKECPVDNVVDYLYGPVGVWRDADHRIKLNISRVRAVEPGVPMADPSKPWADAASGFPFIHGLITHMFGQPVPGEGPGEPSQVERLLWWMSVFYKSGYLRVPQPGQALFVAGGVGQGKTFFAKHLLPALMGSVGKDAGAHLTGQQRWTEDLAGQPVLNVDDENGNVDAKTRDMFQNMIKRYVANGEMAYVCKYGAETTVPWRGRIVASLNTDARSLGLIPDLGVSNGEKVTLLLAGGRGGYRGFGDIPYNQAKMREELPGFARYLLDLEPSIPERYRHHRFGVVEYHHPLLKSIAKASDTLGVLLEALAVAFKGLDRDPDARWEGTATELYTLLATAAPSFVRSCAHPRALGRDLACAARKGWAVKQVKHPLGISVGYYSIPYDIARRGECGDRAAAAEADWAGGAAG